jgi:hypothetical protein
MPSNSELELRAKIRLYVSALASSGKNFVVSGEEPPISRDIQNEYVDSLMELFTDWRNREVEEARADELNMMNSWAISANLNDASKHKWYRYFTDRMTRLRAAHSSRKEP